MNNYYPFGMLSLRNHELDSGLQPGRYPEKIGISDFFAVLNWQSGDYRFVFNGMEKDDEIKGVGKIY